MSTVIPLFDEAQASEQRSVIALARREYGLSVAQGARALNVSPATLERMEASSIYTIDEDDVRRKFEVFIVTEGGDAGKNLLFRTYPLRVARELLKLPIPQMAARYGYASSTWRKIEANARLIDTDKLRQIEHDVRDEFAQTCALSL